MLFDRFKPALVIGILVLSGCGRAEITTEPVNFAIKPGFSQSRIVTYRENKPVRTRIRKEDNRNFDEVSGVPCTMESKEFKASFVTPAQVNFPVTKGRVSSIRVTCSTTHYSASAFVHPRLEGIVTVQPSIAGLVVAAIGTAVVLERDRWSYADDGPIWIDLQ